MAFVDIILQKPSYGWAGRDGALVKPSPGQLIKEAISRVNIFRNRKNWVSLLSWLIIAALVPFLYLYLANYFSWGLTLLLLFYSMFAMSIHTTVWLHRYCTHRAFRFSRPVWRLLVQNLVIKTVPEEIYVFSHIVHHAKSDKPGDPYNARGGLLYCLLAEVNHQRISPDLDERDYQTAVRLISHTGVHVNSYRQYRRWGTVAAPLYTISLLLMNWCFWFTVFYLAGGPGLVCAMFGAALFWFITVRTFNYTGHGKGNHKHRDGIDFDRTNLSVNQVRPGILAGEWHNNHHLFPNSARTGFLSYQLDLPWLFIYAMYKLGMVSGYHDSKKEFMRRFFSKGKSALPDPHSA